MYQGSIDSRFVLFGRIWQQPHHVPIGLTVPFYGLPTHPGHEGRSPLTIVPSLRRELFPRVVVLDQIQRMVVLGVPSSYPLALPRQCPTAARLHRFITQKFVLFSPFTTRARQATLRPHCASNTAHYAISAVVLLASVAVGRLSHHARS